MRKGNLMVGQSGGPTPVINASLAGVIRANQLNPLYDRVLGGIHGIEGVLHARVEYRLDHLAHGRAAGQVVDRLRCGGAQQDPASQTGAACTQPRGNARHLCARFLSSRPSRRLGRCLVFCSSSQAMRGPDRMAGREG